MSAEIRLRRHTDGRWAVSLSHERDAWLVISEWAATHGASDAEISGPDWSELFIAELPEPDGWTDCVGNNGEDARTPYWTTRRGTLTAWIDGVEDDWGLNEDEDLGHVRDEALKLLAALDACERCRAEREATA